MQQRRINYQQGDVLLKLMDKDIPKRIDKTFKMDDDGKLILALGEATGHHHRFEHSKLAEGVTVQGYSHYAWNKMPSYIKITGGNASIYHEEHNPISLPSGTYQVSQIRERDHISNVTRRVVD